MKHQLKRKDFPICTPAMLECLKTLNDAYNRDMPFIHLRKTDPRTIRALIRRDWIFASPGTDGTRYKITGRGKTAYRIYSNPQYGYEARRTDGICPHCKTRNVYIYPGGNRAGYCQPCLKHYESRRSNQNRRKPNRLCPTCNQRPRHITKSGTVRTYCAQCRAQRRTAEYHRRQQRLRQRIDNGDVITCNKCDQPVHVTDNTVFDMCEHHWKSYMNDYNQNRRPNRGADLWQQLPESSDRN